MKIKEIVEMIKDVCNILEDEEKFIIQTHLICHHTWTETTEMFSKKFGYEKERSERTLKRFQNKAIQKMLVLINTTKEFPSKTARIIQYLIPHSAE